MLRWVRSKLDRQLASVGIDEVLRATEARTTPLETRPPVSESLRQHIWRTGDVIEGIYTVKKVFQEGGMGRVCQVHHRDWGIDLALKSPRPEYFQTEGQREAFTNECQTWISLGLHPNVAVCHYVRLIDGVPCVFAEFVDGGSLAEWINQRRLYSADQVETLLRLLDVGIQFAHGIDHAHRNGIIHRDVKPSNALLTVRGQLKVTDFGLARAMTVAAESADDGGSGGRQRTEWITPAYSSPEQRLRRPVSQTTDVWSWAVSILEMFVGGVIWDTGSAAGVALEEYLNKGPLYREIPIMPEPLARLLRNCLNPTPSMRPSSMMDIVGALKMCYETHSSGPYPRTAPKGLALGADALNNRALSFLDLDQRNKALAAWQEALLSDPRHAESIYNSGLVLWRSGSKTEEFALTRLSSVALTDPASNNWKAHLFQAQIHAERGDVPSAQNCLALAGRCGGDQKVLGQVQQAISRLGSLAWCLDLEVLRGHEEEVMGVSFCEGGYVISGSCDRTLRLWDPNTRTCLTVLRGHADAIRCLSGSSTSHIVFSGGRDGILNEWNLQTGDRRYAKNDSQINCIASNGLGLTAIGDAKGNIKLWESSLDRLSMLGTHSDAVIRLSFSTDGLSLTSRDLAGSEKLWSIRERRLHSQPTVNDSGGNDATSNSRSAALIRPPWESSVGSVDWVSRDGRYGCVHEVAGDRSALVLRQFITEGGRCIRSLRYTFPEFVKPYKRTVSSFSVDSPGERWCAGLGDGTVLLGSLPAFVPPSASPLAVSRVMPMADVWSTEYRLDRLCREAAILIERSEWDNARTLLLPALEPSVKTKRDIADLWQRVGRSARRTRFLKAQYRIRVGTDTTSTLENPMSMPADNPQRRFTMYSNHAGGLFLRDTTSGICFQSFAGHKGEILDIALSPDDSVAVSSSADGTARFWDLADRRCTKVFRRENTVVRTLNFSPAANLLAAGCADGSVILFDMSDLSSRELIRCRSGPVNRVEFTPDGQFLLIGSGQLLVLNMRSNECNTLFDTGVIRKMWISSDGYSVCLGGEATNIWDLFWDYEFPSPELAIDPVLRRLTIFLERHRPFASDDPFDPSFLLRKGSPQWGSNDLDWLMADLTQRGFGWVSSEAVESCLRDRMSVPNESRDKGSI